MPAVRAPKRYHLEHPKGRSEEVSGDHFDATVASQVFDSNSEMAQFFGVDRAQPGKWLRGAVPAGESRRLVMDLAYVWRRLTDDAHADDVRDWLRFDRNPRLGHRPLDAIRDGRVTEVVEAWDSHFSGGYA